MGRSLTRLRRGGVVTLLLVASLAATAPAGAQTDSPDDGQSAICVLDAGAIDTSTGSSGQGMESGGLIWRVSYRAQRVTAIDPETLEPVIEKALGQTSAAVLTPLSEVGGLIAVPISGPGQGVVQFLNAQTGETVAAVDLGAQAGSGRARFHLVTAVVTIDGYAYVASGDQLTVIDIDALTNGGEAVARRVPIDHTISELGVVDNTLVLHELMSDRVWSLEGSDLVPFRGRVPWSSVTVDGKSFALVGDSLVHVGETDSASSIDSEIDIIGRPIALAASAESLWVASRLDGSSFVSLVDLTTNTVTATVTVEGPIWWLWTTSDTAFVETPDEALALAVGRCAL